MSYTRMSYIRMSYIRRVRPSPHLSHVHGWHPLLNVLGWAAPLSHSELASASSLVSLQGRSRSSCQPRRLGPGCRTCHGVAAVLKRMIAVTGDPDPTDCVQAGQTIQLLPQVLVEYRLAAGSPPAIL